MPVKANIVATCKQCGSTFPTYARLLAKGESQFCSSACYQTYRSVRETRTCIVCSASFRYRRRSDEYSQSGLICPTCKVPGPVRRPVQERFWEKVNKDGPVIRPELGPCWVWTAGLNKRGYGSLMVRTGRGEYHRRIAHRLTYEWTYGAIPDGLWVLHKCDNPACCRPDHLFLGTVVENTADMVAKKRQALGSRVGGSNLTHDQVRAIRNRYAAGGISYTELGKVYGVGLHVIGGIVRRATWRYVE